LTDWGGREVPFSSALSKHSEETEILGFVGEVDIPTVIAAAAAAAALGLLGELAEIVSFEVGHCERAQDWGIGVCVRGGNGCIGCVVDIDEELICRAAKFVRAYPPLEQMGIEE